MTLASAQASAIYAGTVMHRRFRPVQHTLRYGMCTMLLDLDEIRHLDASLRWFSLGRVNLITWRPEDHLSGGSDVRAEVDSILAGAGLDPSGGTVRLMAMPRMLGFTFNPISVYLCYDANGAIHAVLYEVNNTFGDRHTYVFHDAGGARRPASPTPREARLDLGDPNEVKTLRHSCAKVLHVSPFNDMDLHYDFALRLGPSSFALRIGVADASGPLMVAAETLERRPLTDREIVRGLVEFPLQTLKVVGGIHLEALRLWRKGLGVRHRPPTALRHSVSTHAVSSLYATVGAAAPQPVVASPAPDGSGVSFRVPEEHR